MVAFTHLHSASPPRFTSWLTCGIYTRETTHTRVGASETARPRAAMADTTNPSKIETTRSAQRVHDTGIWTATVCAASGVQRALTYSGAGRRMPRRSARTAPGVN